MSREKLNFLENNRNNRKIARQARPAYFRSVPASGQLRAPRRFRLSEAAARSGSRLQENTPGRARTKSRCCSSRPRRRCRPPRSEERAVRHAPRRADRGAFGALPRDHRAAFRCEVRRPCRSVPAAALLALRAEQIIRAVDRTAQKTRVLAEALHAHVEIQRHTYAQRPAALQRGADGGGRRLVEEHHTGRVNERKLPQNAVGDGAQLQIGVPLARQEEGDTLAALLEADQNDGGLQPRPQLEQRDIHAVARQCAAHRPAVFVVPGHAAEGAGRAEPSQPGSRVCNGAAADGGRLSWTAVQRVKDGSSTSMQASPRQRMRPLKRRPRARPAQRRAPFRCSCASRRPADGHSCA